MRWRMIDKVTLLDPWKRAVGIKTVSLEEYDLLLPLGREGECPESLVLESSMALLRWLVMASSDFRTTAHLCEVERFEFLQRVGAGEAMTVQAAIMARHEEIVRAVMALEVGGIPCARGTLAAALAPLDGWADADVLAGTWSEVYVPA